MKKGICAFLIILLCIFSFSDFALASSSTDNEIKIDGNFDDWKGKPSITDTQNDASRSGLDFTGLQYFADDQYLYLHLEKKAAQKSDPWDFKVVILNAKSGLNHENYLFGNEKPIYAPQFDVKSYFADNKNGKNIAINVSFDGNDVETTFSASNDGKEVEIRMPLESVGLSGQGKQVEFVVGSVGGSKKSDKIDWVPDGEKIVVTTGPVAGKWWTIICFGAVSALAYNVYRKKRA